MKFRIVFVFCLIVANCLYVSASGKSEQSDGTKIDSKAPLCVDVCETSCRSCYAELIKNASRERMSDQAWKERKEMVFTAKSCNLPNGFLLSHDSEKKVLLNAIMRDQADDPTIRSLKRLAIIEDDLIHPLKKFKWKAWEDVLKLMTGVVVGILIGMHHNASGEDDEES